jgi:putative ABC transport system substrate-binding protein
VKVPNHRSLRSRNWGAEALELLHELLPAATSFGVLVDPTSPTLADAFSRGLHTAAHKFGVQLHVTHASTESDLDKVFATLVQLRVSGLIIGPGTLFTGRSKRLGALSVRHAMPTVFQYREFVAAGGLMSYGSAAPGAAECTIRRPARVCRAWVA